MPYDWVPLQGLNGLPVGCFQQWTQHQNEFTVKLREKVLSLTGNDFEITMPDGQPMFKIKGKALSLHRKKTMTDNQGNAILSISDKVLTLFRHFDIYAGPSIDSSQEPVAQVQGHFSLLKTKMTVSFKNFVDGNTMELEVVGNFFDRSAEIKCNGFSVARIHRQFFNAGQILFDDQTFYLTVAPGVDIALITAVVVCLNEKQQDKN